MWRCVSLSDVDLRFLSFQIRSGDYDYLLSMPLWSLTLEKVQELLRQKKEKEKELEKIMKSTPESLWEEDLQKLEDALAEHYQAVEDELRAEQKIRARNRKKQKKAKKGKKKSNPWSESDEEDVDMFSDEDDEDDVPRKGKKGRKKKTVSQKSRLKATTSNLGMPVDLSLEPLSLLATTTSAARKTSAKRASRAKAAASDESSDVTAKKTTRTKASGGSKKAAPPKKTSRTKKKKKSSRIDPDSEAELEALMNDITLNDDEDDEYSVSDAEPRETIASTRPRRSTARQTRFLDMLDDSDFLDEEDDEDSPFLGEDDDDDGEEEFVPETLPPKRTSRGKAATTRRAAAPKRTTKVIEESESEDDSAGPDPTQGLSLAERIALRQSEFHCSWAGGRERGGAHPGCVSYVLSYSVPSCPVPQKPPHPLPRAQRLDANAPALRRRSQKGSARAPQRRLPRPRWRPQPSLRRREVVVS